MEPFRRRAAQAYQQRRWKPFLVWGAALVVLVVVAALLEDRLSSWANRQIDAAAIDWFSRFVSSAWFPVAVYLILAAVGILAFLGVLWRITTPRIVASPELPIPESPAVEVYPVTRQRGRFGFGDDQAKSAYLEVHNTGDEPLVDVEVRISDALVVADKQDNSCEYVTLRLSDWTPTLVYWAKKEGDPPSLRMNIAKGSKRLALVAYSDDPKSQGWVFNTPGDRQPFVSEVKFTVQVSNRDDVLMERDFHIECHPQYTDRSGQRFDLEPWDGWERERPVRKLSEHRAWGARIQNRMLHPPPRGMTFPTGEGIDRFNNEIEKWGSATEACLGGPGALDLITYRNDVGLIPLYDENSGEVLLRQLLTNKNFMQRRLTRLNEIISKKQEALD